jgi:23S rRNA pseudouridine1911/1915/1917 synthase
MNSLASFVVSPQQAGATVAALLREHLPNQSWSQVRQHIANRRLRLNGALCFDPARRLKEGDRVEVLAESAPKPRQDEAITIRFVDAHVVVVEKPPGLCTVRHPTERDWPQERKALTPSLDELVGKRLAESSGPRAMTDSRRLRLRIVHRLDKDTSGLIVFARSVLAERGLGQQFRAHTVIRRYLAIVVGEPRAQRIVSRLVRDRGDGRRGSTTLPDVGKEAITHVEVLERWPGHALVSCRLETGRTHQIRIHLAELGYPVCGEKVYAAREKEPRADDDKPRIVAPRLALHATELGFQHPVSGQASHWTMPLPADLRTFLDRLRGSS